MKPNSLYHHTEVVLAYMYYLQNLSHSLCDSVEHAYVIRFNTHTPSWQLHGEAHFDLIPCKKRFHKLNKITIELSHRHLLEIHFQTELQGQKVFSRIFAYLLSSINERLDWLEQGSTAKSFLNAAGDLIYRYVRLPSWISLISCWPQLLYTQKLERYRED